MSVDQIISLISGFGTLLATIFIIFTLNEMKKQRKNSMSPDIVFEQRVFFIFYNSKIEDFYIMDNLESQENGLNYFSGVKINLKNVGLGIAKQVYIKWQIEYEKIIQIISKYDVDDLYDITYSIGRISIAGKGNCDMPIAQSNIAFSNFYEYILPVNITKKSVSIKMPYAYTKLLAILLYLSMVNKDRINSGYGIMLTNFPTPILSITYKDIQGEKSRKKYKLHFSFDEIRYVLNSSECLVAKPLISFVSTNTKKNKSKKNKVSKLYE